MNQLFRNAEQSAEFLGYPNIQSFECARIDGMVPPPDTVYSRMPFWAIGTLEQVLVDHRNANRDAKGKCWIEQVTGGLK